MTIVIIQNWKITFYSLILRITTFYSIFFIKNIISLLSSNKQLINKNKTYISSYPNNDYSLLKKL